jgi:AcrR family transcriptional regulator
MSKKETILESATRLLASKGYKEASMAELARICGVAQGTIFYHYGTKEELFLAILDEFRQALVEEFEAYQKTAVSRNGLEKMISAAEFYLNVAGKMEDRFLLFHRHEAYELSRINPDCRRSMEAIYTCLIDIFEQAIRTGQADGSVKAMPARKTALIIFTMVDGLVRLNTYNLYDAGTLTAELFKMIRRILTNRDSSE